MPPMYKEQLIVPLKAIECAPPNRCSLDFGGSLIKIAYCSIADEKEDKEENVIINLVGFLAEQLDEALAIVNKFIDPLEDASREYGIYLSGLRIFREKEKIEKALGSRKWKYDYEYALHKKAFKLFTQAINIGEGYHSLEDITLRECNDIVNKITGAWNGIDTVGKELKDLSFQTKAPWMENINNFNSLLHRQQGGCIKELLSFEYHFPEMFPCLVTVVGSACSWQTVSEDGSLQVSDFNSRSGPALMGLGSLLTGAKTYEELLLLAEKGNAEKIHLIAGSNLSKETDDPFSHFPQGFTLFSFARAQGKDIADFSKEDLARAVLESIANDIMQSTLLFATLKKMKTIFFCGNMTNHWLVRHEFMKAYCIRRCFMKEINAHCYFLRNGGYMAAIGGIL